MNKYIPVYSLILEIIKRTSAEVNTHIDHNTSKVYNHVMKKWVSLCVHVPGGRMMGVVAKGELKMNGGLGGRGVKMLNQGDVDWVTSRVIWTPGRTLVVVLKPCDRDCDLYREERRRD